MSKVEGTATVRPVKGEERVAELARMLAGSTADVSMAHARALLAEAAAPRREGSSRVNDASSERDDPRPAVGAARGGSD